MPVNSLLSCFLPFCTVEQETFSIDDIVRSQDLNQVVSTTFKSPKWALKHQQQLVPHIQSLSSRVSSIDFQKIVGNGASYMIDGGSGLTSSEAKDLVEWIQLLNSITLTKQPSISSSYNDNSNRGINYAAAVASTNTHVRQNSQTSSIPAKSTNPQNFSCEAYFFPSEHSFSSLIETIQSAQRTLDICVFSITDDDIANAIIQAHRRGIKVRIISDDDQMGTKGSDVGRLRDREGIPVRVDDSPSHMHNKFAIVDGRTLINGSYNWTKGARIANRENIILLKHAETIQSFQQEFERLWNEFQYEK